MFTRKEKRYLDIKITMVICNIFYTYIYVEKQTYVEKTDSE